MNIIASREVAYTALFNLLVGLQSGGNPVLTTVTRRLRHWEEVSVNEQPALFMRHEGEIAQIIRGLPTRITLEVALWVYVCSQDDLPVGPILNPVLDALWGVLAPPANGENAQTLGGLVHHCWIEGQTQIFEGNLGSEAVAIVPVKILVS